MMDHSLTCSVHPPPAWACLWRNYFSPEYLWMSDQYLHNRPNHHPSGVLCRDPNAAALLLVSSDNSVGLHFLTPVLFAKKNKSTSACLRKHYFSIFLKIFSAVSLLFTDAFYGSYSPCFGDSCQQCKEDGSVAFLRSVPA